MSDSKNEYFISHTIDPEGNRFNVFCAADGDGLVIPKELLRARSMPYGTGWRWLRLLEGYCDSDPSLLSTVVPSTLEEVATHYKEYLNSNPQAVMFLHSDTPDEVKDALGQAETEARQQKNKKPSIDVGEFLGIQIDNQPPETAERPYPGQYL